VNEVEFLEFLGGPIESATHITAAKSGKLRYRIHRSTLPALSAHRGNSHGAPKGPES
jgi:hypothetical protein